MASNVPLTLQMSKTSSVPPLIAFNNVRYQPPGAGQYWFMVLDRTSLKVLEDFVSNSNSAVPPQLTKYLNTDDYIILLNTQGLQSSNLPTGAFYKMLQSLGAKSALQHLEQIFAALNCSTWGSMTYSLVCVTDGSNSFENSTVIEQALIITMQFLAIQVGPGILYTPAAI